MKKAKQSVPPTGQLRQSQLLTTFGPGAMVDLPDHAVLIGGLEHWYGEKIRVYDDRLASRVADVLGLDEVALYAPPVPSDDLAKAGSGITAFLFPTWFLGQVDETYTARDGRKYRTRPLVRGRQLRDGKWYYTDDCKKKPVTPVRFVQACVKGHISDIDWYAFVRDDPLAEQVGPLWFDEGGAGNDFQDIYVRSAPGAKDHGVRRPLSDATLPDGPALRTCRGRQPWLGDHVHEPCKKPARLLTRAASNAYFSQILSVIAIPDSDAPLREAVNKVYDDYLATAEDITDVTRDRRNKKVSHALEGFDDDAVWAELERRKSAAEPQPRSIKQAEIETLLSSPQTIGSDTPDGDFYARARDIERLPPELRQRLERVVLVHRLREVVALVGFTRFEASMPDIDGELSLEVQLAPLAREPSWVPAIENRGEGILLAFADDAIKQWLEQSGVIARGERLKAGFEAWRKPRKIESMQFPGLPYIMLQSLAHLLITAVSLDCGYAASAIRERIYAGSSGHAILLYTGGSGSEGTLGGLVDIGQTIESHLTRALELGRLCSNDPVCAQHDPADPHEERFLHGAACHGCLLIAETSCERRNEFLDRALVVPTVATPDAAFFPDPLA